MTDEQKLTEQDELKISTTTDLVAGIVKAARGGEDALDAAVWALSDAEAVFALSMLSYVHVDSCRGQPRVQPAALIAELVLDEAATAGFAAAYRAADSFATADVRTSLAKLATAVRFQRELPLRAAISAPNN
jgi:hypothetical protein